MRIRSVAIALLLSAMPLMSTVAKPIVIAHRGASGYLPEHTLLAVTAAHTFGADFIEQDIVLSRDGVPVVLHDIYLDATTDVAERHPGRRRDDGRFYAIDFSLAELKLLSVTERRESNGQRVFDGRFPNVDLALRIPTLAEEIELIKGLNASRQRNTGWYIELKAPVFHRQAGWDIARVVLDVLEQHGLNNADSPVYLQCFHDETLKYLRETLKTPLPLIQLIAENDWGEDGGVDYDQLRTPEGLDRIAAFADGIGPWIPQLFDRDGKTPNDLARNAHDRGLLIHPYTLRADALSLGATDFDELQRRVFIDAGVDGAFTDFSDLTRLFIDQHFSPDGSSTGDIP